MESPETYANTISLYSLEEKNIFGHYTGEEIYDLLSVIIIRLSKNENAKTGNKLHQMLTVLLSHKITAEQKAKILETEHDMVMTEEILEGVNAMCDLSYEIIDETIKAMVINALSKGNSKVDISNVMDLSIEEIESIEEEYRHETNNY